MMSESLLPLIGNKELSQTAPSPDQRPQFRLKRILAAVMLLTGFCLAASGYQHGLPIIDLGDEVTYWTQGRAYFDPSFSLFLPNYPPGILQVSAAVQRAQILLGDPWINISGTVGVMRLMSVALFVVVMAILMLLSYRLAGDWA